MVCVLERPLQHDHREDARAGADVAGARRDRAGGDHAGAGVALGWAQHDSGPERTRGVEQRGALGGELPGLPAGGQHLGQQLGEVQSGRTLGDEAVEHREQPRVVVVRR